MTVSVTKKALNVREKLAELDKPTGIAGEAMLRAETPQEQFNLIGAGRRNLIINGDFQVWQRGTSFSGVGFTADRWYTAAGTITKDGFAYKHVSTNTDPYLLYKVEDTGNRLADKDAVFSFYLKTSSGTNRLQYLTFCGTNYLHDVMYQLPSEIDGYTRWACPVKITNANADHIRIVIELEAVNGNTSYLRQVQLELGKVATPFEHRSYGEELALCQRYYYRLSTADLNGTMAVGFATSATGARGVITFPVPMRVAPTGIEHTGSGANYKVAHTFTATTCSAVPSFSNACPAIAGIQFTVASGLTAGQGIAIERNSGTAYIGFTGAEL